MPAAVSGQVRGMTPPGSVIPRVTPAATGHGPDHHRTTGSLTVIPPGPTRPYGSALAGRPIYLHGRAATVSGWAGQNVVVQLDRPVGRFVTGELRCPPLVLEPLAPE